MLDRGAMHAAIPVCPGSHKRHKCGAALPMIRSDLGEPAGVLSWEREFLLPLALDVLDEFVGNSGKGTK